MDDPGADAPFRNQTHPFQPGQMAGHIGLADGSEPMKVTDAMIAPAERIDHLDSNGMSECLEKPGQGLSLDVFHMYNICTYAHKINI